MVVRFQNEGHLYTSIPSISWTSVTRLIESFSQEFEANQQAAKSSRNPRSKWFGISPKKIVQIWDDENKRSTSLGSLHHEKMEKWAIDQGQKEHRGKIVEIFPPIMENGIKIARDQRLEDGVYPEHLIYNEKARLAGQSDLVFVAGGYVDIDDYKTNKKIVENSYGYQVGKPRMMLAPVDNIMDCNYWHYALQLSMYMRMILLKNKHLLLGQMRIKHVEFKVEKRDRFDFPIIKMHNGYPIVKKVTNYEIPYLEDEANKILKTLIDQ